MVQSVMVTCEICYQDLGKHCCKDCEQTFCDNCKIMHLRMKSTYAGKQSRKFESKLSKAIYIQLDHIFCYERAEETKVQTIYMKCQRT